MIRTGKLFLISVFVLFGTSVSAKKLLQIKGSDTLINLVQKLSEEYMKKQSKEVIAVTGGGSGTGIAALINRKCDIANASRQIKDKEVKLAAKNGVNVKRIVVAMDGLSVIVHKDNPLAKLTTNEIGRIFRGEITNWKQLGGKDQRINLYGRQSNSGTFVFFREAVVRGDYSSSMKRMNGNAQIVESVKRDKTGIGYVGVGYVKNAAGITVLKVAKNKKSKYASPLNAKDVNAGIYPITRALNQYISDNLDKKALDFLKYELGKEGQKIVEQEGFFAVPASYKKQNKKNLG
jgi:phosphate transport system substrate-binding protein